MALRITDWNQTHTACAIVDDATGLYYLFQSSTGAELDFEACVRAVLAGTAAAAPWNMV